MIVIGIDPGTNCGWAVLKNEARIASGTWDLKPRRHEGGGMRYLRARQYFLQLVKMVEPEGEDIVVAYEEVRRHQGVDAAHIYGGIIGVITAACEEASIPFKAIPVREAKAIATGKGNASKEDMVKAANTAWNLKLKNSQDDEADALWMAKTLYEQLKV